MAKENAFLNFNNNLFDCENGKRSRINFSDETNIGPNYTF